MKMKALYFFEMKKLLKSPITFFIMILSPLLIVATISYGITPLIKEKGIVEPFKVAIVNEDESVTSRSIIEQFEGSKELQTVVTFIYAEREKAIDLIEKDKIAAIVFIPEGFSRSLRKGENKPVEVVGNYQRPLQSMLFKEMMLSAVDLITAAQSGVNTSYYYLKGNISKSELKATVKEAIVHFSFHSMARNKVFKVETFEAIPNFSTLEYYSISSIVILMLFSGLFTLVVVSDKESDVVTKRLITYGVSSFSWIYSKYLTLVSLLLIQTTILFFLVGVQIDHFYIANAVMVGFIILLTIMAISALYVVLVSLRLPSTVLFIAAISLVAWMSYSGGSIWPLTTLPDFYALLSNFTINKWAHSGLLHSLFVNDTKVAFKSVFSLMTITALCLATATVISKGRLKL